jgi:hypothetical protein
MMASVTETFDNWGGPAPEVRRLAECTDYMAGRGLKVRQLYYPSTEDADGTWVVQIERWQKLEDGTVWFNGMEISPHLIEDGWKQAWEMAATLLLEEKPG